MTAGIEVFEDGTAAFVSARIPAWHQLGTVTDGAMNAESALAQAHLDYEIKLFPVYAYMKHDNTTDVEPVKGKFAPCRLHPQTHEWATMGCTVGDRYRVIQNSDAFAMLNDLVAESGAHFETAGALFDGRQVFVTMELPKHIQYGDGSDSIKLHLAAWNSHDGTSAMKMMVTPVRIVCCNTLRMARMAAKATFSIRHTASAQYRVNEARRALDLTFKYVDVFEREIQKMLAIKVNDQQYQRVVAELVKVPSDATPLQQVRADEQIRQLNNLWNAPTQEPIRGTAWGAYNAVAEWVDWYSPARGDTAKARALRVMNGQADRAKEAARQVILSAAK